LDYHIKRGEFAEELLPLLVSSSDGWTPADISVVVREMLMQPVRYLFSHPVSRSVSPVQLRIISIEFETFFLSKTGDTISSDES
jgi:hypothetical protein